jgi:carbonic anhydrase
MLGDMTITAREGSGTRPTTAAAALAELQAGNQRFIAGTPIHPNQDGDHRASLVNGQQPFAVIFGCSDSRLAAEIIFDCGLGDLYVVRTAGHSIGAEILGSIEYAVTVLQVPLVVVLGHSSCGAVQVARDGWLDGSAPSAHMQAVVDAVLPSVRRAAAYRIRDVDGIVDVHVQRTVEQLRRRSELVATGRCTLVGMSYELATGRVRVIDNAVPLLNHRVRHEPEQAR